MTHYNDMQPRERDAFGATEIMGWSLNNIADNGGHWCQGAECLGLVRFVDSWHPSTDAGADYEILKKVRETWDWKGLMGFENHLVETQESYAKKKEDPGSWIDFSQLLYEPGDYLHAAWLALENWD